MRTFLNKSRTGKTRVWRIEARGDQVITEYGELGGAMQEVSDTALPLNVGKSNEKSAEVVAQETVDRQILLKTRGGYIEEGSTEVRAESVDFDNLPINLRFYKPEGKITPRMIKLLESRKALMGRKRDGEMFPVVINSQGRPILYSRTMLPGHAMEPGIPWAERFPQIVADLEDAKFPPNSILLGEVIMDRNGSDDFKHVERVLRAKKDYALEIQEAEGWLSYYVWDIAFFGGEDSVRSRCFAERSDILKCYLTLAMNPSYPQFEHILPLQAFDDTHLPETIEVDTNHRTYDPEQGPVRNFIIAHADDLGWEGYVVIDPAGVYGDKGYNFRGKTDRPGKFCCKLKPNETDDFVAYWNPADGMGEFGTGKYQGLLGSVQLYQYDSKGELHYISDCGNGFTEKDLHELSNPSLYPMVFEVKYDERVYKSEGEKTNALRFARFLRSRNDKAIAECINPMLD
jgi:hypothetical protein